MLIKLWLYWQVKNLSLDNRKNLFYQLNFNSKALYKIDDEVVFYKHEFRLILDGKIIEINEVGDNFYYKVRCYSLNNKYRDFVVSEKKLVTKEYYDSLRVMEELTRER